MGVNVTKSGPRTEGRFTTKAFAEVLRKLEGNRGAAYLLVSDGLSERCLFFSVGAIRMSSMGKRRARTLEDSITAHPRVDAQLVERARARQVGSGESLEEIVTSHFNLNDVVRECSASMVRDEMLDCLLWEGAFYEYAEGNPPPKIFEPRLAAVKLSFGAAKLLKEVLEAVPVAQRLLTKLAGRRVGRGPSWSSGAPPDAKKEACFAVARGIPPGTAAFDDVVIQARRQGFDALEIADALDKMTDQRVVEFTKKGLSKAEETEHARREIAEIEGALELIINELVARQRLAKGYLAVGDQPKAVYNLTKVGDELAQRNKADEAVETYRQIVKIAPNDFGAREKIVNLFERMKRLKDAIGEGLALGNLYRGFGLFNRAKNILRRTIALEPGNVDNRRELIELLVKLRENDEAVKEYEGLADLFAREENEADLLAVYQNILALDPNHKRAATERRAIIRRKPGFWIPWVAAAALFIVVAVGGFWVREQYAARAAWEERSTAAREAWSRKDFRGAHEEIEKFLGVYPDSRPAQSARELERVLVDAEREYRENRARDDYNAAYAREQKGDWAGAMTAYLALRSTAKETAIAEAVDKRIKSLTDGENAAQKLLEEANRESDLRAALAGARELVRNYPYSQAARDLKVRLKLTTVPEGASVLVNGLKKAETRCTLAEPALPPFSLRFELPGFSPHELLVDLSKGEADYFAPIELDRRVHWQKTLLGPAGGTPLVTDTAVFVGGHQRVYAFDQNGEPLWTRPLGLTEDVVAQPILCGAPGVTRTCLVVGDRAGFVHGLDPSSGSVQWTAPRLAGSAAPIGALADGLAVVACEQDGLVIGLDALNGGRERWHIAVPNGLAAQPTLAGRDLVAPARNGEIQVYDAASGRATTTLESKARPTAPVAVVSGGHRGPGYLVAAEDKKIHYLTREGQLWESDALGAVTAAPCLVGAQVLVAAGDQLVALDLRNGRRVWGNQQPAAICAAPVYNQKRVYLATSDGKVAAWVAGAANHLWGYRTGGIQGAPVVHGDRLYVSSDDFNICAIAIED